MPEKPTPPTDTPPVERKPTRVIIDDQKRRVRSKLGAIMIAGLGLLGPHEAASKRSVPHSAHTKSIEHSKDTASLDRIIESGDTKTFFDNNSDFFRTFTIKGDMTPQERIHRIKTPAPDVEILEDVELNFYKVRAGDTIDKIRTRLARIPGFAYIASQREKIKSFNIPDRELQRGMWLPIPLENKDRYITDEQFARYAARAVRKMETDPEYGSYVHEILQHISETELVASLVAVAKQEAGGEPIGQFELHRWEPTHNVFSFSVYHILMEDAGLKARRTLNLSEGQLYHPENATRLFLAYLKEKSVKPGAVFPLDKNTEAFALHYNGRYWRRINPNYPRNIRSYYRDAEEMIAAMSTGNIIDKPVELETVPKPTPTPPVVIVAQKPKTTHPLPRPMASPPKTHRPVSQTPASAWEKIGGNNLTVALRNVHYEYLQKHKTPILKTNSELHIAAKTVMRFLRRQFGSDTYYPTDSIAIGKDKRGAFIIFRAIRNGKTSEFRLRI